METVGQAWRPDRQFPVRAGRASGTAACRWTAGRRPDGKPWRVGINRPDRGGSAKAVYKALPLENQAMATSGDYRNFLVINGRAYSHIIDPRTGYPVQSGVVSASVKVPMPYMATPSVHQSR